MTATCPACGARFWNAPPPSDRFACRHCGARFTRDASAGCSTATTPTATSRIAPMSNSPRRTSSNTTMPEASIPRDLAEEPLSAKLVYLALPVSGGSAQRLEIRDRMQLADTTTREGVNCLQELGVVEERPCYEDARSKVYTLTD